jgi:hypothetical protein
MQCHMSTCMRTVTLVWLDTLYLVHISFLNDKNQPTDLVWRLGEKSFALSHIIK